MSAGLYRKKPITVEAMFFDGSYDSLLETVKWIETHSEIKPTSKFVPSMEKFYLYIPTLEGVMQANPTDYIIRGMQGEFYPCKRAIFDATYERAGTQ